MASIWLNPTLCAFLCFSLLFFSQQEAQEKLPAGTAAVVNGKAISISTFYERLVRDWRDKEEGQELLNQLVERTLVREEMKARKIEVTPKEVEARLARLKEKYRAESGGKSTFETFLKELGVSEKEFLEQLKLYAGAEEAARQDFQIPPDEEVPNAKLHIWLENLKKKAEVVAHAGDLPARAVAIVRGVAISVEEMGEELTRRLPPARLQAALEGLISLGLLEEEARKKGIEISPTDMQERLQFQNQRYLESNEYRNLQIPYEEYLKLRGESLESLQKSDYYLCAIYRTKLSKTLGNPEEIEKYFKNNLAQYGPRVRLSHIYIQKAEQAKDLSFKDSRTPEMVEEVKGKILGLLQSGKSFEKVARDFSEDMRSKYIGGDLGHFTKENRSLGSEILDAAFRMKVGERSDFLQSSMGFHCIKVTEHLGVPSLAEVRHIVEEDFARTWFRKYRAEANVVAMKFE